jgi:hypothetical protein
LVAGAFEISVVPIIYALAFHADDVDSQTEVISSAAGLLSLVREA